MAKTQTSAYTLIFPSQMWAAVKVLAAVRHTNIRELIRDLLARELTEAIRSGEITKAQGWGFAASSGGSSRK